MDRFERVYQQGVLDVMEIWVDTHTGVHYLFHKSGNAAGFTPLLDPNGPAGGGAGPAPRVRGGTCATPPWSTGALRLAYAAHHGQVDQSGQPYIFHPYHLAEQMEDEVSICVALLHDVVEDTAVTHGAAGAALPPGGDPGGAPAHPGGGDGLFHIRAPHPARPPWPPGSSWPTWRTIWIRPRFAGCPGIDPARLARRRAQYARARAILAAGGEEQEESKMEFVPLWPEDAAAVRAMSDMATAIVREYYDPIIGEEQNTYMLQQFQSVPAIQRQLAQGYRYFFVRDGGADVGFVAFYPRGDAMYLSKFYLYRACRGRGYGRRALAFVAERARELGLGAVELNVNRHNDTLGLYEHLGFRVIRAEKNDIGQGYYMDDYVCRLEL